MVTDIDEKLDLQCLFSELADLLARAEKEIELKSLGVRAEMHHRLALSALDQAKQFTHLAILEQSCQKKGL